MFDEFEEMLKTLPVGAFKSAVRDVCDTAYMVEKYFRSRKIAATAADIAAMTGIIIQRERLLSEKEDADV